MTAAIANRDGQRDATDRAGRFQDDSYERTQAGMARDAAASATAEKRAFEEMDRKRGLAKGTNSAFNQINKGLIRVADTSVKIADRLGPAAALGSKLYQSFAPRGSQYHKEGSFGDKAGAFATSLASASAKDAATAQAKKAVGFGAFKRRVRL